MKFSAVAAALSLFASRAYSAAAPGQNLSPRQDGLTDTFALLDSNASNYTLTLPEDGYELVPINNPTVVYSIIRTDGSGTCFFIADDGTVTYFRPGQSQLDVDGPSVQVSAACFTS